jgi:type II secretion system protein J
LVVKDRLDAFGGQTRAVALIEADLAQAIGRPVRMSGGADLPAFSAAGAELPGQLFALTRTGWLNLDNSPRGELQRVIYALEGDVLKRSAKMPDGGTSQPTALLSNIKAATTRYRDAGGNWRTDWDASDPQALPRAVELVLTPAGSAPVRLLFLVGTAVPAKSPVKGDDAGA